VIIATSDLGRATRVEMILTGLALSKPAGVLAASVVSIELFHYQSH
jgi:hypothetical protein